MPNLFVLYPTGLVASVTGNPPVFDVFKPLVGGGGGIFKTLGAFPLSGFSGKHGTLLASVFTGALGSNRAVAFFVDSWPTPTRYLGFALDAFNRPYAQMSVDGLGSISGQSIPAGSALPTNHPLSMRLTFDAQSDIHNGWHAAFTVNDTMVDLWTHNPSQPWTPFALNYLLIGEAPIGGMASLNGVVQHVQVSPSTEVFAYDVPVPEEIELQASSLLQGRANLTASATATCPAGATLSGGSSLTALASVSVSVGAALAGSSNLAADLSGGT